MAPIFQPPVHRLRGAPHPPRPRTITCNADASTSNPPPTDPPPRTKQTFTYVPPAHPDIRKPPPKKSRARSITHKPDVIEKTAKGESQVSTTRTPLPTPVLDEVSQRDTPVQHFFAENPQLVADLAPKPSAADSDDGMFASPPPTPPTSDLVGDQPTMVDASTLLSQYAAQELALSPPTQDPSTSATDADPDALDGDLAVAAQPLADVSLFDASDEVERAIVSASSVQEIESILEGPLATHTARQTHIVQAMDTSREIIASLSLSGQLQEAEQQLIAIKQLYMDQFHDTIIRKQDFLKARSCSTLLYTFAVLDFDASLVERVHNAVLTRAYLIPLSFTAVDLYRLMFAVGHYSDTVQPSERWLARFDREAVAKLFVASLTLEQFTEFFWAYGRCAGHYTPSRDLLATMERVVAFSVPRFSPPGLTLMLYCLALFRTAYEPRADLLLDMIKRFAAVSGQLGPGDFANGCWASGAMVRQYRLEVEAVKVLPGLLSKSFQYRENLDPRELSTVVWALGGLYKYQKIEQMPYLRGDFFDSIMHACTSQAKGFKFSHTELCNAWQGFAELAPVYRPLPNVVMRLVDATLPYLPSITTNDILKLIGSVRLISGSWTPPPRLIAAILTRIQTLLPAMPMRYFAAIVREFGYLSGCFTLQDGSRESFVAKARLDGHKCSLAQKRVVVVGLRLVGAEVPRVVLAGVEGEDPALQEQVVGGQYMGEPVDE